MKPAVLRVYIENQAILEPIFPSRASKCKQTQKQSIKIDYGLNFLTFCYIITFFFLGQNVIKRG